MIKRIKQYLFPTIDPEVQNNIDTESVKTIHQLSFLAIFFELITLLIYTPSTWPFDRSAWISIGSVLFCVFTCLVGFFYSGHLMRKENLMRTSVIAFESLYVSALSLWSVFVSYRHYARGEQLLTFFAVQLLIVCFIPVRPMFSTLLMSLVYALLYVTLFSFDGGVGLNYLNYAILILISITGMVIRYHSQIRTSEKTVQLQKSNHLLAHANRHDGLTGLRNRKALDEDVPEITGHDLSVYMMDINYFKDINDTYGHVVGDAVLTEAARRVRALFPDSSCYRFGGDEFLILDAAGHQLSENTYSFSVPEIPNRSILLSIGQASGHPENHDQLFQLIAQADTSLYEVKSATHAPEYVNDK